MNAVMDTIAMETNANPVNVDSASLKRSATRKPALVCVNQISLAKNASFALLDITILHFAQVNFK